MEHWSQSLMKMAINYIGNWANMLLNVIESFAPIILWKWKSIFWSYGQRFIPYGRFHKYLLMQKRRLSTNRLGLQGTEQG